MRGSCLCLVFMVCCIYVGDGEASSSAENCSCLLYYDLDVMLCIDSLMVDFGTNVTFQEATEKINVSESYFEMVQFIGRFGNCDFERVPIIDICPNDFAGSQDVREQCESPRSQLPPVDYQSILKATFKNIYCARCHGNSDHDLRNKFKPWISDMYCPGLKEPPMKQTSCRIKFKPRTVSICTSFRFSRAAVETICPKCRMQRSLGLSNDSFACPMCEFADALSGLSDRCPSFTDPDNDLTRLFRLPVESDRVQINGNSMKLSSMCDPSENFDSFFQICRSFVCPSGFYPNLGQCHENSTLYLPANTQPFPNGTREYSLHILVTLSYFDSKDYLLEEFLPMFYNLKLNDLIYIRDPYKEGWRKQGVAIKFNIVQPFLEDFLEVFSKFETKITKGVSREYRLSNRLSENATNGTCPDLHYKLSCTRDISLDYQKETIFVKTVSQNRTIFVALEHVFFETMITQPISNLEVLEVCYCQPTDDFFTLNCTSEFYKFHRSEYKIDPDDDTLEILSMNTKVKSSSYYLVGNDTAYICLEALVPSYTPFFNFDTTLTYLSWTCTSISVICLLASVFLVVFFDELQTLSSKLTAGISITMIVGQVGLHMPRIGLIACQCIGFLTHFSWLSSFFWMSSQALNMLVTFHPKTMMKSTFWHDEGVFKKYVLACTVLPLVIVGSFFTLDVTPGDHIHAGYGRGSCGWMSDQHAYILGFFVPVGISVLLNITCFSFTLLNIESLTRTSSKVTGRNDDRMTCIVYLKLSSVMGFTWIFGLIASFVDVSWLWYVYVILNGLQGLFIFLSFGINRKVRNAIKTRSKTKSSTTADSAFWDSKGDKITSRSLKSK